LLITGHNSDSFVEQRADAREYVRRTIPFYQSAVNLRLPAILEIINEDGIQFRNGFIWQDAERLKTHTRIGTPHFGDDQSATFLRREFVKAPQRQIIQLSEFIIPFRRPLVQTP